MPSLVGQCVENNLAWQVLDLIVVFEQLHSSCRCSGSLTADILLDFRHLTVMSLNFGRYLDPEWPVGGNEQLLAAGISSENSNTLGWPSWRQSGFDRSADAWQAFLAMKRALTELKQPPLKLDLLLLNC